MGEDLVGTVVKCMEMEWPWKKIEGMGWEWG